MSVIVISYYLSGLGNYVFKALQNLGWLESAVYATAVLVPISIVVSIGLIILGRRIIYKRSGSKG